MEKEKIIRKIKQGAPFTSAVVVAACIGVSLSGYQAPVYEAQAQTKETKPVKTEETKAEEAQAKGSFDLEDGIYKGTGTGYAGEISVAVTIKDKQITAIDILSSSDDAAFFNRAKGVIDRIIAGQTLEVDVVSGATYSSNGIISAVKNALTGEKDSGTTGQSQSGNAAAEGSTLTLADEEEAAAYKDGTYYGTGTGFGGTLKVQVVISSGKITSIDVIENHDDSSYLSRAMALINNIIATQSTNVDVVSGATYSSNGIKSAVRDALRQAAVSGSAAAENAADDSQSSQDTSDTTQVTGNFPYKEGIYYGTAEGYNGDIEVAVVLQDQSIKAVLVTKNHDDARFFDRAMEVVKNIMKKQSTDVDVVSGATYSSNGLINAVKNALKEAEKATNGQQTIEEEKKADTTELEKLLEEADGLVQDEYTEASWAVLEVRLEDAKKLVDADKTKITQDEVDEVVSNLNQAMALLEKKDDGGDDNDNNIFKNGIYEGIALCKPDEDEDFEAYNLSLKVTIRDDKIVAVTDVTGDGDSSNDKYINKAANGTSSKKGVASQLIGKSDTEGIDVISGATCSSKAILEACDNALVAAKNSKAESGE
nr:FMN-binding protein [uncultured Dorea sp.]